MIRIGRLDTTLLQLNLTPSSVAGLPPAWRAMAPFRSATISTRRASISCDARRALHSVTNSNCSLTPPFQLPGGELPDSAMPSQSRTDSINSRPWPGFLPSARLRATLDDVMGLQYGPCSPIREAQPSGGWELNTQEVASKFVAEVLHELIK